jgi:hypothetical protein
MVILQFMYPRSRHDLVNPMYFGGRMWTRLPDGTIFDGGMERRPYRLRSGAVQYVFIEMSTTLQSFNAQLQYVEGTHHQNN